MGAQAQAAEQVVMIWYRVPVKPVSAESFLEVPSPTPDGCAGDAVLHLRF